MSPLIELVAVMYDHQLVTPASGVVEGPEKSTAYSLIGVRNVDAVVQ